jgi:hypothetical protein
MVDGLSTAAGELLDISRRRGADGLVALSPAWIAGDKLRITAHPRER